MAKTIPTQTPVLDTVNSPADMRDMSDSTLRILADEVRSETIRIVSKTGGHLGAGLGVVELSVALHAVFDTPRARLIWDVSHQCYPHKILTGRRDKMHSLRKGGGLSGFTKRDESPYDPFGAAHSSTSISAALGFSVARDLAVDLEVAETPISDVIAVIGDGALSAGMAFEALNNAGHLGNRLIVVLNDNDMSIATPTGAMSSYLLKLYSGEPFQDLKAAAKGVVSFLPEPLQDGAKRARDVLKHIAVGGGGGTLFENLGFSYIGPIDGHNIEQLLEALRLVKDRATGPVLIHTITKKGKGYRPAEQSFDKYHGVSSFDPISGKQHKTRSNIPSYTQVFAQCLMQHARVDNKIVAVTAAMPDGTGLDLFAAEFPKRCFDVGIAEQHAVTFCAGMAAAGLKPFCAIYSTFLQRGYDQLVHDVAIQGLPVRFAIDRAGFVGADGATHAGSFDIAFLANLPGFVVMAASDEAELARMVATAVAYNDGPIAFRYPRGGGTGVGIGEAEVLPIGKGRVVREGAEVAIVSLGARLGECLLAADDLAVRGIKPSVIDARFAKPLDEALLLDLAKTHRVIITIEEGAIGGFGSHVMQFLSGAGVLDSGQVRVRSMVFPDVFLDQDSPEQMYKAAGLTAQDILFTVSQLLDIAE